MSRKWQRNKAWEDQNLTGALTPVRWVLRAFSTIPLAVVLLVFIAIYCMLASVPVGLLAMLPTFLIVALSAGVAVLVPCTLGVVGVRAVVPAASRGTRFAASVLSIIVLGVAGAWAWSGWVWPSLRYDPVTREGLMLFAGFVSEYKSVTLRRLPGMEMTETQFYAWWPMRLALVLFVVNMIVTTLRRIEFNFKNMGVLSVHTGIVLIAVGSVFYQRFKQEGDALIAAASDGGVVGPAQRIFYDREEVVLYVGQDNPALGGVRFEQRPLERLPRYNNYNLAAGLPEGAELFSARMGHAGRPARPAQTGTTHTHADGTVHAGTHEDGHDDAPVIPASVPALSAADRMAVRDNGRTLALPVPDANPRQRVNYADPDIKFRVVGYTPYASLRPDWISARPPTDPALANPMRMVELWANLPGSGVTKDRPAFEFSFFLGEPASRVRSNAAVGIEFTKNMDEQRWSDLSQPSPPLARHALLIEVPGSGFRAVQPVREGLELTLGDTGWTLAVQDLAEEPPFPIITKGYEGASSSVAVLRLTGPADADGVAPEPIERWVFHRFPELNQDLATTADPATGRPARGAPDPAIRVSYLDFSRLQIYLDERPDGTVRAIIREPGGSVRVVQRVEEGWLREVVPSDGETSVDLRLGDRWSHARTIERPTPTPVAERDVSLLGGHTEAFVAVEVSSDRLGGPGPGGWSQVVWLPFTKYMGVRRDAAQRIVLPDGREVQVIFGRLQRPFPDFTVSLLDFEMVAYDHRGAPRDYQSTVRVAPVIEPGEVAGPFRAYDHLIKLNEPLRAPFHWDPEANLVANITRRLLAGLDPNQFKLSQAGWDRAGWEQTQRLADLGQAPGPRVSFTILGVGNNPGIHVVAFGSVLMGVGIPWAFYVKPWLLRREKRRLAEAVRTGAIKTPRQRREQQTAVAAAGAVYSEVNS